MWKINAGDIFVFVYLLSLEEWSGVGSWGPFRIDERKVLHFQSWQLLKHFFGVLCFCLPIKVIFLIVFTNCLMVQNGVLWMLVGWLLIKKNLFCIKDCNFDIYFLFMSAILLILGLLMFFFCCIKDWNFDILIPVYDCYLA